MYSSFIKADAGKRTRWQAPLAFDYDALFDLVGGDTEYCVPLQLRHILMLLEIIQPQHWMTRWYNATDYDQDFVDSWLDDLANRLMSTCEDGMDLSLIIQMLTDIKREIRNQLGDGSDPTDINPDAPVSRFDSNDADAIDAAEQLLRRTALCLAVRRFVYATMHEAHATAAGIAGITGGGGAALIFLAGGPIGWLLGAIVLAVSAYTYQQVFDAASDVEALETIVCDLYNLLAGQATNQANFAAAIDALDAGTGTRATAVGILKDFRNRPENYLFMLDALGYGYGAAQAGAENDCCVDDECIAYWDFREGSQGWLVNSGAIVLGEGFVANHVEGGNTSGQIRKMFPGGCSATHLCLHLHYAASQPGTGVRFFWYRETSPDVFEWVEAGSVGSGASGEVYVENATANGGIGGTFYGINFNILHTSTSTIFKTLRSAELKMSGGDCTDPEP